MFELSQYYDTSSRPFHCRHHIIRVKPDPLRGARREKKHAATPPQPLADGAARVTGSNYWLRNQIIWESISIRQSNSAGVLLLNCAGANANTPSPCYQASGITMALQVDLQIFTSWSENDNSMQIQMGSGRAHYAGRIYWNCCAG